jgi:hypothetical protein
MSACMTTPPRPRPRAALLATLVCACALALPAMASAAPTMTVVARGIDNPRHLALGTDGTLYVAAAGRGGGTCLRLEGERMCVGFTGRVLAVNPATGVKLVVSDGLISGAGPDGSFATGPDGVAVGPDGRVDTILTSGTSRDLAALPPRWRQQAGELVRVAPVPRIDLGSIDTFEFRYNSDRERGDRNSNPYAVLALAGHDIVADAGANAILDVRGGVVSLLAVIPKIGRAQPVPTSLALGPDGSIYVGTLAFGAGTGHARIFRIPPGGGPATTFAVGFSAITGLGFGPDRSLYVTELTTNPRRFTPAGAVIRIAPDGTRTTFSQGLVFPAGVAVSPAGEVYVSNYSTLPARTSRRGPFRGAGGQIVRITGL